MSDKVSKTNPATELIITWEPLPDGFNLEDDSVENRDRLILASALRESLEIENINQPILAGALRESLEISGFIQPQMLIASNFGLCATINGQFVAKASDWVYVPRVKQILANRRSYTPKIEGDVPAVVMEFLSETEGGEYSIKRSYPPGKWFFYEQILQVPIYVIFEPDSGLLEFYQLENGRYELKQPDENGRHWIAPMGLFLGTWQGTKESRTGYWLRWWDEAGNLLLWAVEQIEQERQRAEQERQRNERLVAYLQSQGIDPANLPNGE